jgi:methyl-accepting chemotaxis protein
MKDEIRVLLVEDSPDDAVFEIAELEKGGLKVQQRRVDTAHNMKDALTNESWDIILCDYSIPGFGAIPALSLLKEMKCDVPVIIISGVIGEESAVDAMRAGAHDFIVKGKYARLVPAVRREIEEYIQLKAREAEAKKQKAEAVKQRQLAFTMIMQNPQPLLIIDTKFDIKLANEAFLTMSGFSEERLQKMNIREFKILKKSGHNLKEALATKKGVTGEVTVEFPKATHDLEQVTVPLLDKDGEIVSIMAVYNDLTEKLIEAAKREELANYITAYLSSMADNLTKLAKGDLEFNLEIAQSSKTTQEARQWFTEINKNLADVKGALDLLVSDANTLSKAAVEGKLDTRNDASKHHGDFRKIVSGVNSTLDAVIGPLNVAAEYVDRISKGDIPAKITEKYNGDFNEIKNNINQLIDVANNLLKESDVLVAASNEGKLDTRGNADQFAGGWRELYRGINRMLDAILIPIGEGNRVLAQISDGKIDELITQTYRGDHEKMKVAVNNIATVLQGLQKEIMRLVQASNEGKLSERGRPEQFKGAYAGVVKGTNEMLDAILIPIGEGNRVLAQISDGKINELITQTYQGDHEKMKVAVNNIATVLQGLQKEIMRLVHASNEGKLSERGRPEQFKGAYAGVVKGTNEMLDAILIPIGEGNRILAQISDGKINELITQTYQGDHEKMKVAVNNVATVLQGLQKEIAHLIDASKKGQLSERGQVDQFKGAYAEIIRGLNELLEVIVGPLNEAIRISDEYARANFSARMSDRIHVEGDFLKFKESLNNIGIGVSKSLMAVSEQITNLASSAEEAMASVEEVASGSIQVAKNTQAVGTNAERGSQGIRQVLKAMEDLTSTVADVATKSENVSKIANSANQISKEGAELAKKADNGMEGITRNAEEVAGIVNDIKAQMDQIGKIVNVITDLANQTNLLALNAAIEAARAGDAGRGFAVVATEVKSLAQESRASAENIADMIGNLQKRSVQAADAMNSANKTVKEGSQALTETLGAFNKIVTAIDQISRNIEEVASASEEQAASVEEVTASVNEVNSLVRGTAKEAMDAAAASEEASAAIDQIGKIIGNVNVIVDNISKEVGKFKVA